MPNLGAVLILERKNLAGEGFSIVMGEWWKGSYRLGLPGGVGRDNEPPVDTLFREGLGAVRASISLERLKLIGTVTTQDKRGELEIAVFSYECDALEDSAIVDEEFAWQWIDIAKLAEMGDRRQIVREHWEAIKIFLGYTENRHIDISKGAG